MRSKKAKRLNVGPFVQIKIEIVTSAQARQRGNLDDDIHL